MGRGSLGALVAVAIAVAAAACGDDGGNRVTEAGLIRADVERSAVDDARTAAVSQAVTEFGVALYRDVAGRRGGESIAVSPVSVHVALAMTRAGARGTTASELDQVLGVGGDELADGWNGLLQALVSRARTHEDAEGNEVELILTSADGLWAQAGLDLEDDFLEILASRYGAGMHTVDFEETEAARRAINEWVAERTNDLIPELIPPGILSLHSRLVLTNALYLNAPWLEPFLEPATAMEPFRRADGRAVTVPIMHGGGSLPYASGDGWQATALPYVGRELDILLVLPDDGAFDAVEADLEGVLAGAQDATTRPVAVGLPRFELRSAMSLRDALEAMGVRAMFSPTEADLSGITGSPDLVVDAVIHEVFVSVDEKGTEAAAATAISAVATGAPAEPVTLQFDRPFLFAIRDVGTRTPLFLGRVTDPAG